MKLHLTLALACSASLMAAEAPKAEAKPNEKIWLEPPVVAPQYDGKSITP